MALTVEPVCQEDESAFRTMVLVYWQELMPKADVLKDETRREGYFQEQFAWDNPNARC